MIAYHLDRCNSLKENSYLSLEPTGIPSTDSLAAIFGFDFVSNWGRQMYELYTSSPDPSNIQPSVSDSAASVDDYVTVDKSIAKEIDLTGPVAIPVGKYRIKVSSDLLLSFLFSLLVTLVGIPFQINNSNATEEYQNEHLEAHKEQIQLQREENQLLRDFFDSIDSSSSSQSESINLLIDTLTDLLENPQVQKAAPPVPDESVDQIPESGNSNPE